MGKFAALVRRISWRASGHGGACRLDRRLRGSDAGGGGFGRRLGRL